MARLADMPSRCIRRVGMAQRGALVVAVAFTILSPEAGAQGLRDDAADAPTDATAPVPSPVPSPVPLPVPSPVPAPVPRLVPPVLVRRAEPVYPTAADGRRVDVELLLTIDEHGSVVLAEVLGHVPADASQVFDDVARTAARTLRFEP